MQNTLQGMEADTPLKCWTPVRPTDVIHFWSRGCSITCRACLLAMLTYLGSAIACLLLSEGTIGSYACLTGVAGALGKGLLPCTVPCLLCSRDCAVHAGCTICGCLTIAGTSRPTLQ